MVVKYSGMKIPAGTHRTNCRLIFLIFFKKKSCRVCATTRPLLKVVDA